MSRTIAILAVAVFSLVASQAPAAAVGKRTDAQVQQSTKSAPDSKLARNAYRVHRFKKWCTLPLRPARSNVAFANREARGCYRS